MRDPKEIVQTMNVRTTITGVLHVIVTKKHHGNPFVNYLADAIVGDNWEDHDYYAPTYYLHDERMGPLGSFHYRFRGRPNALKPELRGHLVKVTATLETFSNRFGAYLNRPYMIQVGEYVECPYHDDPYQVSIEQGSARIYCMNWDVRRGRIGEEAGE